jgi:glycerol kinase
VLYVDGGVSNNDYAVQFAADILNRPIHRARHPEHTTALGIAFLAGLAASIYKSKEQLLSLRKIDKVCVPQR